MSTEGNYDSPIGWRARLGVIVLSTNLTVEYEFRQMVPEGVSFHVARCSIDDTARDGTEKEKILLGIEGNVMEAARQVAMARPGIILFACTIGSSLKGEGHDREISDRITEATGIQSMTAATALLEAIQAFGLKKIALISPYPEDMGRKEEEFIQTALPGVQVVAAKHLGVISSFEKSLLSPHSARSAARETARGGAEGLLISCTAWRTIEVIEALEKELRIPVITSNQACLWACLKRCRVSAPSRFGQLFQMV